jgi:hypothetical protein
VGEAPGKPLFIDIVSFPGPASYTTGGDTGLIAGLEAIAKNNRVIVAAILMAADGYLADYVVATDKVKVYGTGAAEKAHGTEVDAATNLSGTTFRMMVVSA